MIDTRCDSCGGALDPVADASRFRHRDCPVPPLSVTALDVIERVNRRAGRPVSAVEIDVEEATG